MPAVFPISAENQKNAFSKIIKNEKVSETFLRDFQKEINWVEVAMYQTLSEDFIREFHWKGGFFWSFLSKYQKLSEEFILEFQDDVLWQHIAEAQVLSDDFILKYIDIDRYSKQLLNNINISNEIKMLIKIRLI